ncbi:hypothetical protein C5F47_05320 [Nitrosopumilus cobalaminigenes]|uniref:Uncharacterized protein n=1 Tax=Nitrosopumilus cobalaminigenes TaxID=1470066 RepID=A0A7D5M3P6_9ARCH|nr:hypothetical protein [Nitrosopumilus cobalaminigenes]QLH03009.1 hypothetical protein C5F47_05320 [Nitrosopumilus cobalaminigenes]
MTKAKAIEILSNYQNMLKFYAENWKQSAQGFNNQDLKETAQMLSQMANRDHSIIQSAIDELTRKSVKMTKIRDNT